MDISIWAWVGFHAVVFLVLALDLGVFHRQAHPVGMGEAGAWTLVWVCLSLLFNLIIYLTLGGQQALDFLTGYLIEYSLSVDNIFVFVLIFSYFSVPAAYQHRVLFWGILGALLMRGTMILLGAALLERFTWIIYLFGAFLVFTGLRMALQRGEDAGGIDAEGNPLVRLLRRVLPVAPSLAGDRFLVRDGGRLLATPLLVVLLVVESTDLVFAVDSIPAIFGITPDPFIVYTSNICAILGLRSLYFLLAGAMRSFYYLKAGLAAILGFVGLKMLLPLLSGLALGQAYHVPNLASLAVILAVLAVAVGASLVRARQVERAARPPGA